MSEFTFSCPIPISEYPQVLLAHGSGGKLMHQLLDKLIAPTFANPISAMGHDGATLTFNGSRLAFTTDSFVVKPLFFPGGDIGTLAVNGTVNDLAMCGARPRYLSLSLILEEGLPMETLWRVVQSIRAAAEAAEVQIVTGDTKVVDRGKGDGVFINTAGIGAIEHDLVIAPHMVREGDAILINGDLGRHGIAIMAVREGLTFESAIESDCAPLAAPVMRLIEAGVSVHCLRDMTRGGMASSLVEIAKGCGLHLHIDEARIPIRDEVRAACEILGLDPLYVANEGRFVAFVPQAQAERALEAIGEGAVQVGEVRADAKGKVTAQSRIGVSRIVDMLSGEQLPRIC
ncbi:MAG: hydrogenase expression/formation protein HypE [Candidatus Thermofonsia Clade 1 bacterium]|jgi:hydrogenase expression/formation protein HypE|uniref:Hydrogenase expression/formation protein HypE n=1 Tax=Candidatus Thermofonsia Clade 1 bacterium TaxID=2364210 RepID=A0A2M8PEM8_9CHLR|nr:MAG: hydrogenase expression/formation protein HypE [Candidatus Thermofonsia Clade 1 bacterium]RMF52146.1 MAG: hydrogenase expression/formation protein HypE [Chloroflexota bacterium]